VGSGRHSRNGTVGGQESDGFLVDTERFLVLGYDGAGIFSDGFHCLSETSGFLDGEDVNGNRIGRGSARWGRESLSKSVAFVVRRELS